MTALITVRAFKGSASHLFLERSVLNYEANADRIVRRVQGGYGLTMAPAPNIHDAVAVLARDDDVIAAQLFGGPLHESFEKEIANAVASTFTHLKGDITPTRKALAKVVGANLARDAEDLLSLAEKLAITRTMSKDAAVALCELKIKSHKARFDDSMASPGAWN